MNLLYLSKSDLGRLDLTMGDMIAAVEEGFRRKTMGQTQMTSKAFITPRPGEAGIMSMAAYVGGMDAAAIKWLGWANGNRERGLPLHTGLVILNDPETSLPISVMDAGWITAMRTGAASGVAMKYLGPDHAEIGAVIGCGVEGRSNLAAMHTQYPDIGQLRCYDISEDALDAFVAEAREKYGLTVTPVPDPHAAVEDADIVVTAGSTGSTPFLKEEWLKPGAMAAPVDLFGAWEADLAMKVDKLVTDDYEKFASFRANERLKALPEPYAELGEIIAGQKPGRETPEERTVSILGGIPVDDAVAAHLAYRRAVAQGIGVSLPL